MYKLHNIIQESYKEVDELDELTTDIIIYFAKHNKNGIRKVHDDRTMRFEFITDTATLLQCVDDLDKYKVLYEFINEVTLKIFFDNSTKNYYYSSDKKCIYLGTQPGYASDWFNNNIIYFFDHFNIDPDEYITTDECYKIARTSLGVGYRSIILHELQHALDHFKSDGKYHSDKKSKKYYKELKHDPADPNSPDMTPEEYDIYLTLPHEYWARFSEWLSNMNFINKDFKHIFNIFRQTFTGYNLLDEKHKRIMQRALYNYWDMKK